MIAIILAAGEGKRAAIAGIELHKGNYPLPDGNTPISRIIRQFIGAGVNAVYIAVRACTEDFASLPESFPGYSITIVEVGRDTDHPLVSLKRVISRIGVENDTDCIASVCDAVFDTTELCRILNHPVGVNEVASTWHNHRFTGCVKLKVAKAEELCCNTNFLNFGEVIQYHKSLGGTATEFDISSVNVGTVEGYARYVIEQLAPINVYIRKGINSG